MYFTAKFASHSTLPPGATEQLAHPPLPPATPLGETI